MSRQTDLAWAAGFLDGDGCYHVTKRTNRAGNKVHSLTISAAQSDPRPLEKLAHIADAGNVNGPYVHTTDPLRKLPTYQWRLSGKRAMAFVDELWPYIGEPKREQVQRCLLGINSAI